MVIYLDPSCDDALCLQNTEVNKLNKDKQNPLLYSLGLDHVMREYTYLCVDVKM